MTRSVAFSQGPETARAVTPSACEVRPDVRRNEALLPIDDNVRLHVPPDALLSLDDDRAQELAADV